MLELRGVTLCCIDTANHALALRAPLRSRAAIRYAGTVFPTDALPRDRAALDRRFSDTIARSPQLAQRSRNGVVPAQRTAARAIGRRILAARPKADEVRALLPQAEA